MHVASNIVATANSLKSGIFPFHPEWAAVHHVEPNIALLRCGQVLLSNDKPVFEESFHHLVEIVIRVFLDHENTVPTGALQRLENEIPLQFPSKVLDSIQISRDEGFGTNRLGEPLEVHFIGGLVEAVRVVENDNAFTHGRSTESGPGRLSPILVPTVLGWIVPQQKNVEFRTVNGLADRLLGELFHEGVGGFVTLSWRTYDPESEMVVGGVSESPRSQKENFVAEIQRFSSQPNGCVI